MQALLHKNKQAERVAGAAGAGAAGTGAAGVDAAGVGAAEAVGAAAGPESVAESIEHYVQKPVLVTEKHTCKEVYAILEYDRSPCAVVCDPAGGIVGLVMKERLFGQLGRTFGASLFHFKPITRLMEVGPLVIEVSRPVTEVIELALQRDTRCLYDCIIVRYGDGRPPGIVSVGDLLKLSRSGQRVSVARQMRTVAETQQMLGRIGESVQQVSAACRAGNDVINRMSELTDVGSGELRDMLTLLGRSERQAEEQQRAMSGLVEHVHSTSRQLQYIRDVADELNLLAINAAIEAARAGAPGRSFGVVADQVGVLATSTKAYAGQVQDTLQLLLELVDNTARSVSDGRAQTIKNAEAVNRTAVIFENLFSAVTENGLNMQRITSQAASAGAESDNALDRLRQLGNNLRRGGGAGAEPGQ